MNKLASLLLFAGGAAFALAARRGSADSQGSAALPSGEATPPPPSTATMQSAPDVTMTPAPTPSL
ncbi:MAG: hypothetical protein Q8J89_03080 [Caulobacter sp.]|nr:hypothetical protein [Caulobacter sp.]